MDAYKLAASDLALESWKVAGNTALSQSAFGSTDHVFIALKFEIGSRVFSRCHSIRIDARASHQPRQSNFGPDRGSMQC